MKKLDDLYISNMNEAAMAIDEDVNVEMQRLCTETTLELCYVPLYKIDPQKTKSHSTMLDPCINILRMLDLNQMCRQQMSLDLLKQGFAEGMKMYILI